MILHATNSVCSRLMLLFHWRKIGRLQSASVLLLLLRSDADEPMKRTPPPALGAYSAGDGIKIHLFPLSLRGLADCQSTSFRMAPRSLPLFQCYQCPETLIGVGPFLVRAIENVFDRWRQWSR